MKDELEIFGPGARSIFIKLWVAVGSVREASGETHLAPETLEGSFFAVSTQIFATKYSFCSIFEFFEIFKIY